MYPFDVTGKSPRNIIIGESKSISLAAGRTHLFRVPLYGPYFMDSLVIKYTPASGPSRILTQGVDYHPSFQYVDGTRKINTPIYAGISFTDLTLNGTITYNYQTVGGTYLSNSSTISSIETNSLADPMFTTWDSLVTLPVMPDVGYPWASVNVDDIHRTVEELDRVGVVVQMRPKLLTEPGTSAFIPTASEIGLGNVPNFSAATDAQAIDPAEDSALMTPKTTALAASAEVTRQLALIGYLVPINYSGSINITNDKFTVKVGEEVYIIKAASVPFVTSGVWSNDRDKFELFQYARKVQWNKTHITVTGNEPVINPIGLEFNISVDHDSRVVPQLELNDVLFLVYSVDYKISNNKLYVKYPLSAGDRLTLLTKRSLISLDREPSVNKLFTVNNGQTTFDISDVVSVVDVLNLRITLNDFVTLNANVGDYTIVNGILTIAYPMAAGDVVEIENIDSTSLFGKTALRNLLLD